MHRKAIKRALTLFTGLACVLAAAGCKPDIPLIPFVQGDAYPALSKVPANDPAYYDGSTSHPIDSD